MDLTVGDVIDRRYIIEGVLGQGGMAIVYRVRHAQLGTLHALKVLTLPAKAIAERLLQEGRVQARLNHPNIVAVSDVIDVDGSPGLLMEYIQGPSLEHLLKAQRLSIEQVDAIAAGVIGGVAHAHSQDLIHRDLKPANVLLQVAAGGVLIPKVTDFGLAKILSNDGAGSGTTRSGMAMGTPAYMPPEQIRDAKSVDRRADIYALGAICYELATGHRAFPGQDVLEVFVKVRSGDFVPPRELVPALPARMEEAINRAMKPERTERWPTCEALLAAWQGGTLTPTDYKWDDATLKTISSMGDNAEMVKVSDVPTPRPSSDPTFAAMTLETESVEAFPEWVGPYRVLARIQKTAAGVTYRGRHRSSAMAERQGGDVAIEVADAARSQDVDFRERFEGRAASAMALSHPSIAPAHDLVVDDQHLALVRALVDGDPLLDLHPSPGQARRWARELADAVSTAHSAGLVHGHLDDSVLVADGKLTILGFGLERSTVAGTVAADIDAVAWILGKLGVDAGDSLTADDPLTALLTHLEGGDTPPPAPVARRTRRFALPVLFGVAALLGLLAVPLGAGIVWALWPEGSTRVDTVPLPTTTAVPPPTPQPEPKAKKKRASPKPRPMVVPKPTTIPKPKKKAQPSPKPAPIPAPAPEPVVTTPAPAPAPAPEPTGPPKGWVMIACALCLPDDVIEVDGDHVIQRLPHRMKLTEGKHTFKAIGSSGVRETTMNVKLNQTGPTTLMLSL